MPGIRSRHVGSNPVACDPIPLPAIRSHGLRSDPIGCDPIPSRGIRSRGLRSDPTAWDSIPSEKPGFNPLNAARIRVSEVGLPTRLE